MQRLSENMYGQCKILTTNYHLIKKTQFKEHNLG